MVRFNWFGGGIMALSLILSGCGSVSTQAHSASQAPVAPSSQVSGGHSAVHIVVQKSQGHLTVRLLTSHAVPAKESAKLQSAVNQLNQLLEQLQNP
ncbi:hypothetical protein [Sulfobacillus thermosulfidooxidans]|uniref:hypothetical protein n=1 Tax=Sulfobacillus thermosulfidooxidans TaxID=28034 RepID=UPI0006B600F2|nr:hypothetical protein [Sulfobacillus thermosulfidooxidans]